MDASDVLKQNALNREKGKRRSEVDEERIISSLPKTNEKHGNHNAFTQNDAGKNVIDRIAAHKSPVIENQSIDKDTKPHRRGYIPPKEQIRLGNENQIHKENQVCNGESGKTNRTPQKNSRLRLCAVTAHLKSDA